MQNIYNFIQLIRNRIEKNTISHGNMYFLKTLKEADINKSSTSSDKLWNYSTCELKKIMIWRIKYSNIQMAAEKRFYWYNTYKKR